ncbi:MAG: hypothetical protein E6344_04520 [Clostridium sp.]|nr:hypothetical protein [Clostridium sp.]MDU7082931.1 hypothetical protein [Clostridium sp.]
MPYGVYAECPCCGKTAKGEQEIEQEFGYRTMEKGKVIPQSYCRVCRSAHCEAGNPKH